jgi:hypothetical protein
MKHQRENSSRRMLQLWSKISFMRWMIIQFIWNRLPPVTMPNRIPFGVSESMSSSSPPGLCFVMPLRFITWLRQTVGKARRWYSVNMRGMDDSLFSRFSFPYHCFYCCSTACQIGISMATRELTWGILTSGLVSIFFHRHVADDTKGEPHHILSCSDPIENDAKHPSLFALCAATLLGGPGALAVRPVSLKICPSQWNSLVLKSNVQPMCDMVVIQLSLFSPQMSHARQPRYPVRTLLGVRKVTTFGYRAGVRGQCLSKVFLIVHLLYTISYHLFLSCY